MKRITICMGSSCFARGNQANLELIQSFIREHDLGTEVQLVGSRCEGKCASGPNLSIDGQDYHNVDRQVLADLLAGYAKARE